jgi:dTDP-3-amino-3,4,6-trideoxy-alpha-D-glucose transaminase
LNVPFVNLARTVEALRPEIDRAIRDVLESGWFILGAQCRALEAELAAFIGTDDAVGVASGTDAIELALRALEVGAGDEVVTQANTCVPTVAAIARAGATPVLCDVEPDAGTMDPESLAGAIGSRTRAVVPVHLYGQCCDMDSIMEIADARGLAVIEDCAQSLGAELRGRKAGTFGAAGCFSFYPTKNLGAFGDGGAIATDDEALARRLRLLRQYGQQDRYRHVASGVNSRFDELQAAILRAKFPHLDSWNRRRAEIAMSYTERLLPTSVEPLPVIDGRRHVFHLYVVKMSRRADFQADMKRRGIATLVHYPIPVHRHEPYRALAQGPVSLTNAERWSEQVVSLPLYPELTDQEVAAVGEAARQAAALTA